MSRKIAHEHKIYYKNLIKMGDRMKKTVMEHRSFLKILLFFVLVISSSMFVKLSLVRRAFADPDGSGNNFFYKGSFAFGTPPANKFITYQMMTYEAFGSVFTNTGSVKNLPASVTRYVYLPEFIWTNSLLNSNATNLFEVIVPFGQATQHLSNPSSQYENSSTGLGDILVYEGVSSKTYSDGDLSANIFPQVSFTVPAGSWNNDSSINLGGDEWQIMPTLTGEFAYNLPSDMALKLDYAIGYSYNEGHSAINMAEVNEGGASITNPGNNFFADIFLNYYITPALDIYNETSYVNQGANNGYVGNDAPVYMQVNNGYKDVASGFGIDYHIKNVMLDARVLRDLHGDNGPDGFYSQVGLIMMF